MFKFQDRWQGSVSSAVGGDEPDRQQLREVLEDRDRALEDHLYRMGNWIDYTPTTTNITAAVINSARYRFSDNGLDLLVHISGTATGAGSVSFSLPLGLVATAFCPGSCLIQAGGLLTTVSSARVSALATAATVYGSAAGANFGAGAVSTFVVQFTGIPVVT